MSTFNLFILCFTASNLPWFREQHYRFLCSTVLTALDFTFKTRHIHNWVSFPLWPSCFIISGAIRNCPPLIPSSILNPFQLEASFSSVLSFCLFILFMGVSRQEYWSGLPFPLPADHILSELFSMTRPSWVALQRMTYSFTELCKPPHQNKAVIHEGDVPVTILLIVSDLFL